MKQSRHKEFREDRADPTVDLSRTLDRIDAMDANLSCRIDQLELRIAEFRADLIRWSFVFMVGAVAAVATFAGILRRL